MLVKLLSKDDKAYLLQLAELLSIADKPMLWDGKTKDEITPRTDMKKVSFVKGEAETKLLTDWWSDGFEIGSSPGMFSALAMSSSAIRRMTAAPEIERLLLDQLEHIPLHKNTEDSVERLNAVSTVLHRLLEKGSLTSRHAIRIVLYELMLMALADGSMSSIEYRFLEIFKQHYRIDDCDFEEILERAETMYREAQKTVSLILE